MFNSWFIVSLFLIKIFDKQANFHIWLNEWMGQVSTRSKKNLNEVFEPKGPVAIFVLLQIQTNFKIPCSGILITSMISHISLWSIKLSWKIRRRKKQNKKNRWKLLVEQIHLRFQILEVRYLSYRGATELFSVFLRRPRIFFATWNQYCH